MFLVRLWQYFGVTGIFSVLLWLAACGCAVAGFAKYKDKRTRFVWLALLLAVLAFYGAKENSSNVSAIDVDRTEELALARQRQQEQARRRETERRKELMFAEESVDEMRDWVEDGDEDTGEGEDDDASAAGESGVPLYQQRGPVERDAGKKVEQKEIAESIGTPDQSVASGRCRQGAALGQGQPVLDAVDTCPLDFLGSMGLSAAVQPYV